MKWKDKLVEDMLFALKDDIKWAKMFSDALLKQSVNIHLAIFNEPFISMLFNGKKTMESRFSINSVSPYNKIEKNDIVLVKKSGGGIQGVFKAKNVLFFSNLNSVKIGDLERKYGKYIGWDVDPEFLKEKKDAKYLTLIEIIDIKQFEPISANKNDRTAWTLLKLGLKNTLFDDENG